MTPETSEICRAAELLEQGVLPDDGGWQDQSAVGCDAIEVAANELCRWRRIAEKEALDEARRRVGNGGH